LYNDLGVLTNNTRFSNIYLVDAIQKTEGFQLRKQPVHKSAKQPTNKPPFRKLRASTNTKPIVTNPQDPGPDSFFAAQATNRTDTSRNRATRDSKHRKRGKAYLGIISVIFSFTALMAVISYPKSTTAAVIYIFSSVFYKNDLKKAEEINAPANLQTMSLLSAPLSPLSSTSSNKNILASAVVDDTALSSENVGSTGGAGSVDPYTSDRISLYTVHPGDTIGQIAEMYNVSVSTILWANDLKKGASLQPNQVIVILPISGIKYTVKKGDTIASVAKAYRADVDEINRFNDLEDGAKLAAGTELIIPNAEMGEVISKSGTTVKPGTKPAGSSGASTSGYFTRPTTGIRTQGIHGHNGVDIASAYGTSIVAAAEGEVILSRSGGWGGGYGNYVVIKHPNGMQTLYAHMSENLVSAGQHVNKGQIVGRMGSTGDSTGVHLHFEVRGGRNPF
jgi:LysM repeat protein